LYTEQEQRLLDVRPGITDFASIVFADEGDILAGAPDPDLRYQQIIRPWKSRMGLFYIDVRSLSLDMALIYWTVVSGVNRPRVLAAVSESLRRLGADADLVEISRRRSSLPESPPPGANEIVHSRRHAP
jgi:hypothetical protein